MKSMKIFRHLTLALSVAAALSACSRSNTLPPLSMYPGQMPAQYNNTANSAGNLPGTTANPLSNDALPSDVTVGKVGSIVGRVVTRSGRPLHNVEVSLESNPAIKTTSQQGDFTLMNVPAGQQNLVLKFGSLTTTVGVNVVPNIAVAPAQNPVLLDGEIGSDALAFANPNRQIAAFKVDQDFLNQWQPTGVEVSGGNIYVAAIDVRNITHKGTVIKMNAETGEEWDDLSSAWLGFRHPLNSTTRGLAMNQSGSLLVTDKDANYFTVDPNSGDVQKNEADSAIDVAGGNGVMWFSSVRGLEKSDDSGSSRTLISGVAASGMIGADSDGNAYVPVQAAIVKVTPDGESSTIIKNYLHSPADVAIDPRNGDIYVLDGGEIKRYDKDGQFIVSFGSSALDPSAIDLDDSGALYVADFGRDQRSAQIIKFEAVPLVNPSDSTAATEDTSAADAGFDGGLLPADQPADQTAGQTDTSGTDGLEEISLGGNLG